jgi:hypothetical protein
MNRRNGSMFGASAWIIRSSSVMAIEKKHGQSIVIGKGTIALD